MIWPFGKKDNTPALRRNLEYIDDVRLVDPEIVMDPADYKKWFTTDLVATRNTYLTQYGVGDVVKVGHYNAEVLHKKERVSMDYLVQSSDQTRTWYDTLPKQKGFNYGHQDQDHEVRTLIEVRKHVSYEYLFEGQDRERFWITDRELARRQRN